MKFCQMVVDNTRCWAAFSAANDQGKKQVIKSPVGLRTWDFFKHGIEFVLGFEVSARSTK